MKVRIEFDTAEDVWNSHIYVDGKELTRAITLILGMDVGSEHNLPFLYILEGVEDKETHRFRDVLYQYLPDGKQELMEGQVLPFVKIDGFKIENDEKDNLYKE
jgi:hypothetical protein